MSTKYSRFWNAVQETILHGNLDVGTLADLLNIARSTLYDKANPYREDHRLSVQEWLHIMHHQDDVSSFIELGHALNCPVTNIEGIDGSFPSVQEGNADVIRAFANLVKDYADAIRPDGDGGERITMKEAKKLEADARIVIANVVWFSRAAIEAAKQKPEKPLRKVE